MTPGQDTSPENIEKVHKLVIENRRISLYELEEATGISYGSIHNILHDELHVQGMCKMGPKNAFGRAVP